MTKMTATDRIALAQEAFENGFTSQAGKKRATEELSLAFSAIRTELTRAILAARTTENEEANNADYWAIPYDLHQVRDRHFEIAARYVTSFVIVRDLLALREAIKAAPIAALPVKSEIETKTEVVRKSIMEEMTRRHQQYVDGLAVAHLFNGLSVSVNAHWVHGHKGTQFIRCFFYLYGRVTPLQTILAIADTLKREEEAK